MYLISGSSRRRELASLASDMAGNDIAEGSAVCLS